MAYFFNDKEARQVQNEYFEWMYHLVCDGRYVEPNSYRKLLMYLHTREFTYIIPRDKNRAGDGYTLRYRFTLANNCEDAFAYLDGPCSVLEMMIALAVRCEESIMDDPNIGDRTQQWFWGMISNLGLGSMLDDQFDKLYVEKVVDRFLNREYEPNGKGGLFTVRDRDCDMRDAEIWYQLNYYLDSID